MYKYNYCNEIIWFSDWKIVGVFFCVSLLLTSLLLAISVLSVPQNRDEEKISSYECGFQPFEDTRQKFDVKYYVIGILFIIFDIEILLTIPWIQVINIVGLYVMCLFIYILIFGFIYEIWKGVLKWN